MRSNATTKIRKKDLLLSLFFVRRTACAGLEVVNPNQPLEKNRLTKKPRIYKKRKKNETILFLWTAERGVGYALTNCVLSVSQWIGLCMTSDSIQAMSMPIHTGGESTRRKRDGPDAVRVLLCKGCRQSFVAFTNVFIDFLLCFRSNFLLRVLLLSQMFSSTFCFVFVRISCLEFCCVHKCFDRLFALFSFEFPAYFVGFLYALFSYASCAVSTRGYNCFMTSFMLFA